MEYLNTLHNVLKKLRLEREIPGLIRKYTRNSGNSKKKRVIENLFNLIQEGKAVDDQSTLKLLRNSFPELNQNQFSINKNRLLNKLANLVMLINPNNFEWDAYKKSYFNSYKYLLIARILANTQAKNVSLYFAKLAFTQAQKFQHYELYTNIAGFLSTIYSNFGDQKSYHYYKKSYWYGFRCCQSEKEIIFSYYDWLVYFQNFSRFDEELQKELAKTLDYLNNILNDTPTFISRLYFVRLQSIYYEMTYEYENLITLWHRFDKNLADQPRFQSNVHQFESALKKMLASLNTKQFEKGTMYAEEAKNRFQPGQHNWFIFQEYWFLLLVHKKHYQEANAILEEVFQNRYYAKLPPSFQEKWVLMNGYMAFAIESNWDNAFPHYSRESSQLFRINKMLNQFPKGSQDKSGINAMVMVLQFLFYLNRGEFQKLIQLQEPFLNYYYRYLRQATKKQKIALFMKMLIAVLKKDFDYDKVLKATQSDYHQLTQTRIYYEGGYEDLEVLPFEALWEWILEQLKGFNTA